MYFPKGLAKELPKMGCVEVCGVLGFRVKAKKKYFLLMY